jgi:hypothetical protein
MRDDLFDLLPALGPIKLMTESPDCAAVAKVLPR